MTQIIVAAIGAIAAILAAWLTSKQRRENRVDHGHVAAQLHHIDHKLDEHHAENAVAHSRIHDAIERNRERITTIEQNVVEPTTEE